MPKQLTIDEVREYFRKCGLILDEDVYINTKTPMDCHDNLGYKYSLSQNCVADERTKRFEIISPKNKWTLYNIQHYIDLNGGKAILLSTEYKNQKTPLYLKCPCGEIYKTNSSRIQNLKKFTCTKCSIKKKADKRRIGMDILAEKCKELGFELIIDESECVNNIVVKDKDGYKYRTTMNNIKLYNDSFGVCNRFHLHNPFELFNMRHYLEINNLKVKLSDSVTENFSVRTQYVDFVCCDCGNVFKGTWSQISQGRERCLTCVGRQSNLEYKVEQYLKELKVEYVQQKRFKDCRNKNELPFDFYLPKYNYIIEVHGSQHYYENEVFSQSLEEQKERDEYKKNYCISNNIGYLEIPFWYIDGSKIERYKKEIDNIILPK